MSSRKVTSFDGRIDKFHNSMGGFMRMINKQKGNSKFLFQNFYIRKFFQLVDFCLFYFLTITYANYNSGTIL